MKGNCYVKKSLLCWVIIMMVSLTGCRGSVQRPIPSPSPPPSPPLVNQTPGLVFGRPAPSKPIYVARILTMEQEVNVGDFITIIAQFEAYPTSAFQRYIDGPNYIVMVERRFARPTLAGSVGGYRLYTPGYFDQFDIFRFVPHPQPAEWKGLKVWRFSSPSKFYTWTSADWIAPKAGAYFIARALLPKVEGAFVAVQLERVLSEDPKPEDATAAVKPRIIGDFKIYEISFEPLFDSDGKIRALGISFRVPGSCIGTVEVLKPSGELVKTVVANRNFYAGSNWVWWDITDNAGQRVPKGRYVIKITVQVEEVTVSASETIPISDLIIANLRFKQVKDANNNLIAVDILFSSWPASTGKVEVLTPQGRLVKTVVQNASFVRGTNTVRWDLTDNSGKSVPNGVYLVRVTAQAHGVTETLTKTLTIQR